MSINFQEILKELEYRVEHGIIDLTKEEQVTKLTQILKENGVSNANEMAQKARVYFSYINEDDVVKNRKTGNVYTVKNFDAKKHDKPTPDEIEKIVPNERQKGDITPPKAKLSAYFKENIWRMKKLEYLITTE